MTKMCLHRKAKSFKVEVGRLSSMLQSRHLFMAPPLKWVQQGGVRKREEKALREVKRVNTEHAHFSKEKHHNPGVQWLLL